MRVRHLAALLLAIAVPSTARADDELNYLVGPVLGVRLGGPEGNRGIWGLEGGVGWGPERINAGVTHRLDTLFGYVELDPWYILGGSLGFGVDANDGKVYPVVGLWEGIPLKYPDCDGPGLHDAVTIAAGYRWTGVHELYVTVKAGKGPDFCWD